MTCFVCGAQCGDDYALQRFSPLGYEDVLIVCDACAHQAFPVLAMIEGGEREVNRKHEERQRRHDAAMRYLRAAPTPKEYKRRRQEITEQGI